MTAFVLGHRTQGVTWCHADESERFFFFRCGSKVIPFSIDSLLLKSKVNWYSIRIVVFQNPFLNWTSHLNDKRQKEMANVYCINSIQNIRRTCQKLQQFRASISACIQISFFCLEPHIFYQNWTQKSQGSQNPDPDKDLSTNTLLVPSACPALWPVLGLALTWPRASSHQASRWNSESCRHWLSTHRLRSSQFNPIKSALPSGTCIPMAKVAGSEILVHDSEGNKAASPVTGYSAHSLVAKAQSSSTR